jgi:hypothetical protein
MVIEIGVEDKVKEKVTSIKSFIISKKNPVNSITGFFFTIKILIV